MRMIHLVNLALAGACTCLGALGQASFDLNNVHSQLGLNAPVYDWTGSLLSGSEWRAELYGGAAVDSLNPAVDFSWRARRVASFYRPGYFRRTDAAGDLVVPDMPPEGWAWLQVKVWDVDLGATYEQASARGLGGYGESALFYAPGGDPGVGSIPTGAWPLIGLESFSVLQETPEPSTWALLLLGGAGLWWRRRRS